MSFRLPIKERTKLSEITFDNNILTNEQMAEESVQHFRVLG